jgi:hypothetical protein
MRPLRQAPGLIGSRRGDADGVMPKAPVYGMHDLHQTIMARVRRIKQDTSCALSHTRGSRVAVCTPPSVTQDASSVGYC